MKTDIVERIARDLFSDIPLDSTAEKELEVSSSLLAPFGLKQIRTRVSETEHRELSGDFPILAIADNGSEIVSSFAYFERRSRNGNLFSGYRTDQGREGLLKGGIEAFDLIEALRSLSKERAPDLFRVTVFHRLNFVPTELIAGLDTEFIRQFSRENALPASYGLRMAAHHGALARDKIDNSTEHHKTPGRPCNCHRSSLCSKVAGRGAFCDAIRQRCHTACFE